MDTPSKTVSGVLGLAAFAVACLGGLAARDTPDVILLQAIIAMLIGAVLGRIIGAMGAQGMREHVERHIASNPPAEEPQELLDLREARGEAPGNNARGAPPPTQGARAA